MKNRRKTTRRGTAEIELILCCPLLITIILLSLGLMKISNARQDSNRQAMFEAYQNATTGGVPLYTGDAAWPPLPGFGSADPNLPNRVHDPSVTEQAIVLPNSSDTFTATVSAKAAMISPAWTFSAYPVGQADQLITQQWFTNYVEQSHAAVQTSLALSPPWTP